MFILKKLSLLYRYNKAMQILQILFFLLLVNSFSLWAQEKVYFQLGLGYQHSLMEIKENSLAYPSGYQNDPLWQDYRKKKLNPFISYSANIGYHFHPNWSVESGIQSGAAGYKNLVDAFYESYTGGIQSLSVASFEQSRYFNFIKIPYKFVILFFLESMLLI